MVYDVCTLSPDFSVKIVNRVPETGSAYAPIAWYWYLAIGASL